MAFEVLRQSDFSKGVFAAATRFAAPRNCLLRSSNLIGTTRGGLRTVDGSQILSTKTQGGPWAYFAIFNPSDSADPARLIGLSLDRALTPGRLAINDCSSPASVEVYNVTGTGLSPTPNMVQLLGRLFIAPGLGQTALLLDDQPAWPHTTSIVNNWQGTANYSALLRSTTYQVGEVITTTGSDGNTHVYQAQVGGSTADIAPHNFPIVPDATVVDGQVVWQFIAHNAPPFPPGAGFVFYHLGFPWIWGTAATYTADGLYGPDGLSMGNLNDPNMWNPLFNSFLGKNDGQLAQGGSVLTMAESGIPATAQLILFKSQSTYNVIGAFPNIQIQQVPLGMGCCAPNSVQTVPGVGVMRLSFWGVTVFTGQSDVADTYTDPIRPYLFGGTDDIIPVDWTAIEVAASFQTVNPPGYCLLVPLKGDARNPGLTRGFFFDTILKAWFVLDFRWALGAGALLTQQKQRAQSVVGGFYDGVVRQVFNGDVMWDSGASGDAPFDIQWMFRLPGQGPTGSPLFYRRLNLRAESMYERTFSPPYLHSASWRYQVRDGLAVAGELVVPPQVPLNVPTDPLQNPLNQSISIDRTAMGGATFDLGGQGQVVINGVEIQHTPKPPSRVGI